jgi:hypothetical protein
MVLQISCFEFHIALRAFWHTFMPLFLSLCPIEGDLLTLGLKLDGTDLDDLKNATIVEVAPLRQSTLPEGIITRWVV